MVPIFNCWDLFRNNRYRFAVMHQRYRVEVEGLDLPSSFTFTEDHRDSVSFQEDVPVTTRWSAVTLLSKHD